MPEKFENGTKFDGKKSLQDFDAIELYLHRKNQSVSFQKRRKMFFFHHFSSSFFIISRMCRLKFRFQNLPAKNVPFSCERRLTCHRILNSMQLLVSE